jgi:hypothetical protein
MAPARTFRIDPNQHQMMHTASKITSLKPGQARLVSYILMLSVLAMIYITEALII